MPAIKYKVRTKNLKALDKRMLHEEPGEDYVVDKYREALNYYFINLRRKEKARNTKTKRALTLTLHWISKKNQLIENHLTQFRIVNLVIRGMQPEKYASNKIYLNEKELQYNPIEYP